jgi:hypothetical protein
MDEIGPEAFGSFFPFALSLSKGRSSPGMEKERCFDKLSTNGGLRLV